MPVNDCFDVLSIPVIVRVGRNSLGIAGSGASLMAIVMESPPQAVSLGQPLKFSCPVYVPAHTDVGVDVSVDVAPPPPQEVRKTSKKSAAKVFIKFTLQMEGAGDRFANR